MIAPRPWRLKGRRAGGSENLERKRKGQGRILMRERTVPHASAVSGDPAKVLKGFAFRGGRTSIRACEVKSECGFLKEVQGLQVDKKCSAGSICP